MTNFTNRTIEFAVTVSLVTCTYEMFDVSSSLSAAVSLRQDFCRPLDVMHVYQDSRMQFKCSPGAAFLNQPGISYGLQHKAHINIYMCSGQKSGQI